MLAQNALIFRLLLKMTVGECHGDKRPMYFWEGKYPTLSMHCPLHTDLLCEQFEAVSDLGTLLHCPKALWSSSVGRPASVLLQKHSTASPLRGGTQTCTLHHRPFIRHVEECMRKATVWWFQKLPEPRLNEARLGIG